MANGQGISSANDAGDSGGNKEVNPAANSSVTADGLLESDSQAGEKTRRDTEPHIQKSETGGEGVDPGRTPGKSEGVEDAEERGNQ